jgi:PhnB protein
MHVEPYLFFEGRCEEAINFYKSAVGAEVVMLMRYKEAPDQPPPGMLPPNSGDKVMHATVRIGNSNVNLSDGGCSHKATFGGFSLSLNVATPEQADRHFAALAEGGTVTMPIGRTFFSPRFGMLTDRFGMGWMIFVPPQQ